MKVLLVICSLAILMPSAIAQSNYQTSPYGYQPYTTQPYARPANQGVFPGSQQYRPAPIPSDSTTRSRQEPQKPLDPMGSWVLGEKQLSLEGLRAATDDQSNQLASAATNMSKLYENAPKKKGETSDIQAVVLASYYENKANAKGCEQVSQVANEAMVKMMALQVAQNQRIIELLEQLNRK